MQNAQVLDQQKQQKAETELVPVENMAQPTSADEGSEEEIKRRVEKAQKEAPFWRRWGIAPHMSVFTSSYTFHVEAGASAVWPEGWEPDWAHGCAKGIVFVGACLGMLLGGFLGDYLGRRKALLLSYSVIFLGFLIMCFSIGQPDTLFAIMITGRFISGIGAGALYPLSSCLQFEQSSKSQTAVAWAFWWYIPATGFSYLGAILFNWWFPNDQQAVWRSLFIIGALLPLIVMALAPRSKEMFSAQQTGKGDIMATWKKGIKTKGYWISFIGTGGTWLLFDISNYGVSLALPDFTDKIFQAAPGVEVTVAEKLWRLFAIKFPAPAVAGLLCLLWLHFRGGLRSLMAWGFVSLIFSFGLLLILWEACPDNQTALLVALIITQATLMWGCQFSTYLYPTVVFPMEIRSTFHGLSAFAGKIGAIIGSFAFSPIEEAWGTDSDEEKHKGTIAVISVQIAVAVLGLLLTWLVLENPPADGTDKELTASSIASTTSETTASSLQVSSKGSDTSDIASDTTAPSSTGVQTEATPKPLTESMIL
jgi:MFS family permease